MPRIPASLFIKAYRKDPLLPLLLKECRSLDSAHNELRWLRERALRESLSPTRLAGDSRLGWRTRLRSMCHWRSRGYPLQYILGDQPFGDLEILCRPGVLIPRPETESYTFEAAKLIRESILKHQLGSEPAQSAQPLRVLDLCTGTGCIALLLHALLAPHCEQMQVLGIDISPKALNLARRNLYHNLQRGLLAQRAYSEVEFHRADVLGRGDSSIPGVEDILQKFGRPGVSDGTLDLTFDLLISNPPYISTSNFRDGTTARSVRLFEPRLALVPPIAESPRSGRERLEDVFYRRILALALKLRPRITVLECGDLTQARRVIDMHNELSPCHSDDTSVEVWPSTERDLAANGFHPHDGSRCVIIRRSVK